ncbi:transient receptor potential cation channel subfamily V member 1-like [Lampris incognitus]|uniref:transient receptor potential cation channel subfamily V member 1-like n=1 Tax=Lampris incognitus TaxID=2546036 RepID=UPI0024B5DEBC|nr:transient receptor potential cation channel subfamily V member 1-like [Lampris incognitus]
MEQQNEGREEEASTYGWLLKAEDSDRNPTPMDTCVKASVRENTDVDHIPGEKFTKEKVFEAACKGETRQLQGLLNYLQINDKRLTSPEFIDKTNGKTALLKALLNLKDGKNDTIEIFLDIAEKTGDLKDFVNTSYCDFYYKGQTALHIAIERRSFDHMKLLVQKGAEVQAKANGEFFQLQSGPGFYFGELPLSLAACTNQLDMVSFLMENPYNSADLTDKDSQGNTVLHALVVIADNSPENTDFIIKMYDEILIRQTRLEKKGTVKLEDIENHQGMNPLKLAAKLGKIRLFRHLVQREFMDEETKHLSRKFTEWVYGPVHSSLYDTTSLDTNEENSVLEIIVFGSEIPDRHEMLQIEPLRSLLEDKWKRFASKIFLLNFLVYLVYLAVFTTVAFYRKEAEPPFPVEDHSVDHLRCTGELITALGAVYFFCKAIVDFKRKPPNFKALHLDGFNEILFFFQAILLLVCIVLYVCGRKEYIGPLVLSLAMAWVNILYYSRGSQHMGMYNVMMQRMILTDILRFLFVYVVFLFGFSAAVVTLVLDNPPAHENNTTTPQGRALFGDDKFQCKMLTYKNVGFTMLEMFKFTIGMGDLEFTDHMQYKEVFYILLISYIILTYILLLNMLIALMGDTVEKISRESENIWKLQRALTILDLEKSLPRVLRNKLYSDVVKPFSFKRKQEYHSFIRVEEMDWKTWRSNLVIIKEEDSGDDDITETRPHETLGHQGSLWRTNPLLGRIRARRQVQLNTVV